MLLSTKSPQNQQEALPHRTHGPCKMRHHRKRQKSCSLIFYALPMLCLSISIARCAAQMKCKLWLNLTKHLNLIKILVVFQNIFLFPPNFSYQNFNFSALSSSTDCSRPLGMTNHDIKDWQLAASSAKSRSDDHQCAVKYARLHKSGGK